MTKTAFITGINGMDGSYLTEFLLDKGYIVHGMIRRTSSINTKRLDNVYQDSHEDGVKLFLHYGDMSDSSCIERLVQTIQPDEVYNLAAMSHVKVSFEIPEYSGDICGLGTLRILEAVRKLDKPVKFYQAGTSELYGGIYTFAQSEETPLCPRSPYAIAKMYAYWITKNYRESYNLFAVNGILFNHTSPRRGETFVEQKIVKAAVAIHREKQDCLYLGNIYSCRDFGHSKDFVEAMWMMLQRDSPKDYVIASGTSYRIKDIVIYVFSIVGITLTWKGYGEKEYAMDENRNIIVRIDKKYFRPSEVETLEGDAILAQQELGWEPKYTFQDILKEMVEEEQKKYI